MKIHELWMQGNNLRETDKNQKKKKILKVEQSLTRS